MSHDPIDLGAPAQPMTLHLDEGSDFVCTLASEDGDWPSTAVARLHVGEQTWTAELDGTEARFEVDRDDVALALDAERFKLVVVDGDVELVWGRGYVVAVRDGS